MKKSELLPKASKSVSQFLAVATRPLRLLGLSVVMFGLLGSAMALHAAPPPSPSLVGTWIFEVSFGGANCSPGDIVLFSCDYGLMTFHSDGTMAEVDTFYSGAKQSWGPGVWKQRGSTNVYDTTFEQLQFGGAGTASHYDFVWGPVTLSSDGNTFTAQGWFASYNFDGSPITLAGYSGTFKTTASRMPLLTQPLQ
jgi:hypothetical protein